MNIDDLSYLPEAFHWELEDIPRRCRRWCYNGDGDGDGGDGGPGDVGGVDFGDPGIGAEGPSAADFGGIGFGGDVDAGIGLGGSEGADFSGESAGIGGFGGFAGFGGGGSPFDPSGLQKQIDALKKQLSDQAIGESRFDQTRALEAERFGLARGGLEPFAAAGRGALEGFGTTEAFGNRLQALRSSPVVRQLIEERERAGRSQLAAGGLSRSGFGVEQIADVSPGLLLGLEGTLAGRQERVAGRGLQAAGAQAGLGDIGALAGLDLGQLQARTQTDIAERGFETDIDVANITGRERSKAAKSSSTGQALGTALGIGASFIFSDPNLKTNVRKISDIGSLGVYEWEWVEDAPPIVTQGPSVGFMADEVERVFPEYVGQFAGHRVIDMGGLLEELEAA